ncbi:MAG: FecR domain-containing protein [Kiritimatiellia bacterium]|nr:FecR domain-containing protein [Kiritimatiellia bacterium]MDP6847207.1 FecR domain-containing protein [Kiritimatiellia bacterium]
MSDSLDVLILRYLDGTAGPEDVRRLDERLRSDKEARHALVVAAAQDVQLKQILAGGAISKNLQFPNRSPWRSRAVAAAAVLIVGLGLGLLLNRYPAPLASGSYTVVGGGEIERGSVVATSEGNGTITLGNYCRVRMETNSTIKVEGKKYAEQVFLQQGTVLCEADRGVGEFRVRTTIGTVYVTGTKFTVQMPNEEGGSDMFDKRMVVQVLAGAVLVNGAWGTTALRAGEEASLPPPETMIGDIVANLDLPADTQKKMGRTLSASRVAELRASYRAEMRGDLFDAARSKLQSTMPKIMPDKVSPKVRAIRSKKRAGPPSKADIARIRMASQKRARKIMMNVLHETADELTGEAMKDDRLIAWLLAKTVRAKLPGEKIAAFDTAVKEAGASDREPDYITRAEAAIEDTIKSYDPDITGIIDLETGKVIVSDEELGVPLKDDALAERIARTLNGKLADLGIDAEKMKPITPMLTNVEIEGARANYCIAVRARLFEAARKKQVTALPEKMPTIVQSKVMAIRTRVRAGGPPAPAEIARIQGAVMKKTRAIMMHNLHDTADAVAVKVVKDEKLVTAYIASAIKEKLPEDKKAELDAALQKAGITGDESPYIAEIEGRIELAIETHDPDLAGIVSPVTGKVIVEDNG